MKYRWPVALILIIGLGSFLRLYQFRAHMTFQSDQGRDALIAKSILKDGNLALIGPVTSVGNMYLGPFYYYFMTPFLALTYPSPTGPAYAVAIISILTIGGLFWVAKKIFNVWIGLVSALMFTIMPAAITYARFSWNPNIAPILGLGLFFSLDQLLFAKKPKWWVGVGLSTALLLQTHYVTLSVLPIIFLVWLFLLKNSRNKRELLRWSGLALLIVGISFLPLIIFDLTHNQVISREFIGFIFSEEQHLRPVNQIRQTISDLELRAWLVAAQFIGSESAWLNRIILLFNLVGLTYLYWGKRELTRLDKGLLLGLGFIVSAIGSTAFYTSTIFEHYLLYLLPIICFYYAILSYLLAKKFRNQHLGLLFLLLPIILMVNQVSHLSIWHKQAAAIDIYQKLVAETITKMPEGRFNFTLLSHQKDYYGLNYRYFFEVNTRKPQAQDDYKNLDYLVLIDELGMRNPLDSNAYEILIAGEKSLFTQFLANEQTNVWIYKILKED